MFHRMEDAMQHSQSVASLTPLHALRTEAAHLEQPFNAAANQQVALLALQPSRRIGGSCSEEGHCFSEFRQSIDMRVTVSRNTENHLRSMWQTKTR